MTVTELNGGSTTRRLEGRLNERLQRSFRMLKRKSDEVYRRIDERSTEGCLEGYMRRLPRTISSDAKGV